MTAWFPLTLLCAVSLATGDAFAKKALRLHNEYLILWLRLLLASMALLPLLLFVDIPSPGRDFFLPVAAGIPLETVAALLYIRALKISPLGLTVPFLSLTPVFLTVIPFLLIGERISTGGGAGIFLIACGSYVLHLGKVRDGGILAPLRAVARERGSVYMIVVAFLYSITSTLGKMAITASSPLFFAAVYFPLLAAVLTPIALYRARGELRGVIRRGTLRASLLPAACTWLELVTHMIAMSLAGVAYMIAVKRISLLASVLYGKFLFGEKGTGERMAGAALMVAGIALIVSAG